MTEAYWQPIETAPKDGTPILALVDNDKVTVIVWDGFFSEWSLSVGHQYCLDVTGWYGLPSISKPPKTEREQIVEEVWESKEPVKESRYQAHMRMRQEFFKNLISVKGEPPIHIIGTYGVVEGEKDYEIA